MLRLHFFNANLQCQMSIIYHSSFKQNNNTTNQSFPHVLPMSTVVFLLHRCQSARMRNFVGKRLLKIYQFNGIDFDNIFINISSCTQISSFNVKFKYFVRIFFYFAAMIIYFIDKSTKL